MRDDYPRWVETVAWLLAILTLTVAAHRLWQVLP